MGEATASGRVGIPELLVVLFFAALIAAPFLLKRKLPNRAWLGMVLAVALGPWGHWYITGGRVYVLGLWVLFVLLSITLDSALLSSATFLIISAFLMSRRLSRSPRAPR